MLSRINYIFLIFFLILFLKFLFLKILLIYDFSKKIIPDIYIYIHQKSIIIIHN